MKILNLLKLIIKKIFFRNNFPPYKLEDTNILKVGKLSFHNGNFQANGDQKITIGSFCAFGKNVSIITSNHDYNFPGIQGTFYRIFFDLEHPGASQNPPNKERTKGGVDIGNDVWIADNATILSGVRIGNGACIGNNCVVTKNVEPYSIVVGIPAKEIKKRFSDETIELLETIQWWDWNEERIKRNKKFFTSNLNKLNSITIDKIIK